MTREELLSRLVALLNDAEGSGMPAGVQVESLLQGAAIVGVAHGQSLDRHQDYLGGAWEHTIKAAVNRAGDTMVVPGKVADA